MCIVLSVRINQIFKTGLNGTVKEEIILGNPAILVDLPKYEKPKIKQVLTLDEQKLFCEEIKDNKLETLFITTIRADMRLGEILNLK